jgi:hypothetical protein
MKNKLIREIKIFQAYDKRNDNPKKNYGISSCKIWFIVKGKEGAVTVNFFTNWFLPSTVKEYKEIGIHKNRFPHEDKDPFKTKIDLEKTSEPISAGSWDYHAIKPHREWQKEPTTKDCLFLDNKPCYCDGSYCRAKEYLNSLLEKGSEAVFKMLEKDYRIEFKKVKQ